MVRECDSAKTQVAVSPDERERERERVELPEGNPSLDEALEAPELR